MSIRKAVVRGETSEEQDTWGTGLLWGCDTGSLLTCTWSSPSVLLKVTCPLWWAPCVHSLVTTLVKTHYWFDSRIRQLICKVRNCPIHSWLHLQKLPPCTGTHYTCLPNEWWVFFVKWIIPFLLSWANYHFSSGLSLYPAVNVLCGSSEMPLGPFEVLGLESFFSSSLSCSFPSLPGQHLIVINLLDSEVSTQPHFLLLTCSGLETRSPVWWGNWK